MAGQGYDYGEEFVEVRRDSLAHLEQQYNMEHEYDGYVPAAAGVRRTRADSISLTPQDYHGEPTHSESEEAEPEMTTPYFSTTNNHLFQSSFRGSGRKTRERAPLEPRLTDLRAAFVNAANASRGIDMDKDLVYDSEVEMRRVAPELQEPAMIDDILSMFMRVGGKYMWFSRDVTNDYIWRFPVPVEEAVVIPRWFAPSLRQMAAKILRVAVLHMTIYRFVSVYARPRAGLVNQALCAGIRSLLKSYYDLISQLEHRLRSATPKEPFTLQQVWFHVHPTFQVFERLANLIVEIQQETPRTVPSASNAIPSASAVGKAQIDQRPPSDDAGFTTMLDKASISESGMDDDDDNENGVGSGEDIEREVSESEDDNDSVSGGGLVSEDVYRVRGGHTLNVITRQIQLRGGDASTKQLYEFLLSRAMVPFLGMLRKWIHDGELEDIPSFDDSAVNSWGVGSGEFMVASYNDAVAAKAFVDSDKPADVSSTDELGILSDTAARHKHLEFVSVPDLTPVFLLPYADKIVRTGKYLNILRACGVDMRTLEPPSNAMYKKDSEKDSEHHSNGETDGVQLVPGDSEVPISQQSLVRELDNAYIRANKALLKILFTDGQMLSYLSAVKRYLLFEKADFITHFLDLARAELSRAPRDMSPSRLQSFLELSLLNPASVAHDDPLKDNLQLVVESSDLLESLDSLDKSKYLREQNQMLHREDSQGRPSSSFVSGNGSFASSSNLSAEKLLPGSHYVALHLRVPFPLSIVLDKAVMSKYRTLSRFLLTIKNAEQTLASAWTVDLQLAEPKGNQVGGPEGKIEELRRHVLLQIHTIRHRMLASVQQIMYYCCWDVIEPQWAEMTRRIKEAKTVDELCSIHDYHLHQIFQQCGLTASKMPKIILDLIRRCNVFSSISRNITGSRKRLFPRFNDGGKKRDTNIGRALARVNDGTTASDLNLLYGELVRCLKKLNEQDYYWKGQLASLLKGLDHYARKFDEIYFNLAVRLDCNNHSPSRNVVPV